MKKTTKELGLLASSAVVASSIAEAYTLLHFVVSRFAKAEVSLRHSTNAQHANHPGTTINFNNRQLHPSVLYCPFISTVNDKAQRCPLSL